MPLTKTNTYSQLFLKGISLALLLSFLSCTEQSPSATSISNLPTGERQTGNTNTSSSDSILRTTKKQEKISEVTDDTATKIQKEQTTANTSAPIKSRSMPKVNRSYSFPYDLDNPDYKGNLPKELIEISGLTYDRANNNLLAINDEAGRLYTLDSEDCKLLDKKEFGKNGDYEGIEIVNNMVYIVKSNGNITPIDIRKPKVKKTIKTSLTTANDVEGLGYDPTTNELLLACKGTPALKKKHKLKNTKAFYAFDLDRKELNDYPKFTISDNQLEDFFDDYLDEDLSKKKRKKLKNRLLNFSPSAIAKHPMDENFYILSSIGKVLLVCNSYGRIAAVEFLNDKKFSQPEGVCFAPDGTMYISNEGRSVKATIMRFGQL